MLSQPETGFEFAEEKRGRILIVDDEEPVRQALKRLFRRGYDVEVVASGEEALQLLNQEPYDVVISDMRMPGMNGAELLKNCYQRWPEMIRILLTGFSELESAISAINDGKVYRYVAKPWDNDELKGVVIEALDIRDLKLSNDALNAHIVEQNSELSRLNKELEEKHQQEVGEAENKLHDALRSLHQEFNSMVHILVGMIESRLGEDKGGSETLARMAKSFAEFSGLSGEAIQDVYYAALLKNFGKISFSDSIVQKSLTQMSPQEKKEFARFSITGQTSLMMLEPLQNAANIIRSHTELYNGRGFPDRLSGEAIPKEARILRIVSDYAELQNDHNFLGQKLTAADAQTYLLKMSGQRYDRELVDVFMEVLKDFSESVVSNVERVAVCDARVGMVLAGNLVSPAGVVLLSADTQLTERHVDKLHTLQRQFEGHQLTLHIHRQDVA